MFRLFTQTAPCLSGIEKVRMLLSSRSSLYAGFLQHISSADYQWTRFKALRERVYQERHRGTRCLWKLSGRIRARSSLSRCGYVYRSVGRHETLANSGHLIAGLSKCGWRKGDDSKNRCRTKRGNSNVASMCNIDHVWTIFFFVPFSEIGQAKWLVW